MSMLWISFNCACSGLRKDSLQTLHLVNAGQFAAKMPDTPLDLLSKSAAGAEGQLQSYLGTFL